MRRITLFVVGLLLLLIAVPLAYFATVDLDDFGHPLLNAARDGDTARILQVLADGADPNMSDYFDNTPLSIAAHFGQTRAAELLLTHGAEIDGIRGARTPLQCAAYSGRRDTAAFLLQKNADPNLSDRHGFTALSYAAAKGDSALVRLLLDYGANIEHSDRYGWRALHVALRSTRTSEADRLETVITLLEYGADPNANNPGGWEEDSNRDSHVFGRIRTLPNQGNTPVAIAASNEFTQIVALLKAHGGT